MKVAPMARAIVIPSATKVELLNELRKRNAGGRKEAFAMLLAAPHQTDSGLRLLVRTVIIPEEDAFVVRNTGFVHLRDEFSALCVQRAVEEKLIPVHVHTHPSGMEPVFSTIDDDAEKKRSEELAARFDINLMGSIVFDARCETSSARIWTAGQPEPAELWTEWDSAGMVDDELTEVDEHRFTRQVQAFGALLQTRLRRSRVAIIGLGGLGAQIAQNLAYLGFRNFVLIDPDVVDVSNLNRLVSASFADVGRPKIAVAEEMIHRIAPEASMAKAFCAIDGTCIDAEKEITACDFVICATDNHSSRLRAQQLCAAFLRPLFNVGVGLTAVDGRIDGIEIRVTIPSPGLRGWCLVCAGGIDLNAASRETADPISKRLFEEGGYLPGTPSPAVIWVNALAAAWATAFVHEKVVPFGLENRGGTGSDLLCDSLTGESFNITHPPGVDCPFCSHDGLWLAVGDRFFETGALGEPGLSSLDLVVSEGPQE